MAGQIHVIGHPLVQHKLTLMRMKDTSTAQFRALLREISMLLAYEVTHDLPLIYEEIETPLAKMRAPLLEGKKIVLINILRAGSGMVEGMLRILPSARVGHIGLYRDPETLGAVEYYFKLPGEMADRDVILVDPMLATGGTATGAVTLLKEAGVTAIRLICHVVAPEGVTALHQRHPDVPVYCASVDRELNSLGYILPGLGDAGDRTFGT